MSVAAIEVEAVLLGLKVGFLILLYLFIWRIVRTVAQDVRLPQESFVLAPQQVDQHKERVEKERMRVHR